MRIKRSIAIPATIAATLAVAMGLATPAYADITTQECNNRGGTAQGRECNFYLSDYTPPPSQSFNPNNPLSFPI